MKPRWKKACLIGIFLGIVSCASAPQSFDYHDDRDEKPGPGLFSGKEGRFVIYDGPKTENKNREDPWIKAQ